MSFNLLFFIVFLSQLLLISYYYPKQILNRINFVLKKYPPDSYPKLYPESATKLNVGRRVFQGLNLIIIIIGLTAMFSSGVLSSDNETKLVNIDDLILLFGMLQFLPFLLMEIAGFKQFKLMRKSDLRTSRTAELIPRRLFDFVYPVLVWTAVLMFAGSLLFVFYIHEFTLTPDFITMAISLSLCNTLFIGLTIFNLSGKTLDPYQSKKDRIKQIEFTVRSFVFISIFVSIFMAGTIAFKKFELDQYQIIFNSFYWQLIAIFSIGAMLKKIKVEDIDFDVYKDDKKPG